jgi:uncharacterized protein (DUF302 family)
MTISYGFTRSLAGLTFVDAIAATREALAAQGFGVLSEIDVQATLKAKLDLDHRPYIILGACNPSLASSALAVEPHIGLLLPCNVVVQELEPGEIRISIADPRPLFELVDNPELEPIAKDVTGRLLAVLESLA